MIDGLILSFFAIVSNPPIDSRDLNFMYAQEAFVASAVPGFKPPANVYEIIQQAGDDEYCAREAASKRLRQVDPRWLYYGVASKDLEIRMRCNTILRARATCKACNQTGLCVGVYKADDNDNCVLCGHNNSWHFGGEPRSLCTVCQGKLIVWNHSMFDEIGEQE